ncbi:MAG: ATP12 family chaperone protein [Janthinobacterium lividum]
MKRFYTTAEAQAVADGWTVALDGRPIRTPAKAAFVVPTLALAAAAAAEWAAQGEVLDPRQMPLTGFAYAAIDRVAPDRPAFAADLARFAETELLCYRADQPPPLVARQAAEWDPLLAWAAARYDVGFTVTSGIIHTLQPLATMARIGAAFAALDAFRLAALHPIVTICGSALIGLAVSERHLDAAAAFATGQLDELWQAEKWGIDPLAAASLAARRAAVDTAVEFLDLIEQAAGVQEGTTC